MHKNPAFLRRLFFLFFAFLCLISIGTSRAEASEREAKTIRVGYPPQEGLTMCNEEGEYSGYTYEYLMEIAQYTGWKYEFVKTEGNSNEQILKLMDMLKNGEIDLLGSMYYDESLAEMFSYPGYSYGTNYRGLFVPDDSSLTESNIYKKNKVLVSVFSKSLEKNDLLEQFAQMNNLNVEQIVTDNHDEFKRMVEDETADALLSTDVTMKDRSGMRAVAHFSPTPFYIATTKGNIEMVQRLDYAISTIDQVNPNFSVQLYNKYFSQTSSELYITDEEKEFIENSSALQVVMYSNKPPFQYVKEGTGKPAGITVEVLEEIARNTGLKFKYNTVSTFEEYQKMLKSGKADISADALLNYQDAIDSNCTLTLPWNSLPIYMIFKDGTVMEEKSSYAVPYFLRNTLPDVKNVVYYDTVLECLDAVSNGKADGSYVGEFCSQYYFNSGAYPDLKFLNMQDSMRQKLCFGIRNTDDFYVLSLFNKAITHFSEDKRQEIIYRNTYRQQNVTLSVFLENHKGSLAVFIIIALLVMFSAYIISKNQKQKEIAFEVRRYNSLSNLMNEYFYEYDVNKDELVLSDKCADYFNCSRSIKRFAKQLKEFKSIDRAGIWQIGEYIVAGKEESVERSCLMQDKTRKWMKIISTTIHKNKKDSYVIGKITDIQDIKAEQIRLEQQASLDGLTGIYNIVTIKQKIKDRLERAEASDVLALIILDIDNFKHINDRFGHYSGDAVLIQVAGLISNIFQPNPAGRLGGDEFLIFTENMSEKEIGRRCQLVCENMAEKTNVLLEEPSTLSIGIAFAKAGQSYEELYREADTALYDVKSTTKNGYLVYKEQRGQNV